MTGNAAYEPQRQQTPQEKIEEWEGHAAGMLDLDQEKPDVNFQELQTIFRPENFSDSVGQQALRDIERLKDLKKREGFDNFLLKRQI